MLVRSVRRPGTLLPPQGRHRGDVLLQSPLLRHLGGLPTRFGISGEERTSAFPTYSGQRNDDPCGIVAVAKWTSSPALDMAGTQNQLNPVSEDSL